MGDAIFQQVNSEPREHGLVVKTGTAADATLIDAASSSKNKEKKHDPEMSEAKKGNQWYLGMKAHIEVDQDRGQVRSGCVTPASAGD